MTDCRAPVLRRHVTSQHELIAHSGELTVADGSTI